MIYKWFRILLVKMAILGTVILTTIMLDDLFQQEPLSILPSPKDVTKDTPPLACKCKRKHWPGSTVTDAQFNLSLPWLSQQTTLHELESRHPNLPFELLHGAYNKRCSLLPTIFSIEWRNRIWQQATLDASSKFLLYSAFFDPETDGNGSIRLLGVSRSKTPVQAWCHIWFSPEDPPRPVRVANIDYLDYQSRNSGRQMPFLLRCPLHPNTTDVPLAVSLTGKPCAEATNLLRVVGGGKRAALVSKSKWMPEEPTSLAKMWVPAVCGPALFYYHEDFSVRLVEWLELLRAQGFNQVFLYVTDVHPNITLVLRHYVREGFVQITDYTYPPPYVNEPSLRRLWTLVERQKMFAQENVYFTDCVLRHMHQYRFIAHFDTDEVPILPKHDSFPLFLEDFTNSRKHDSPPGYRLRGHYFYENLEPSQEAKDLPKYLWALRHTERQAKPNEPPTSGQFKPIFDMNAVRGVFSHGTLLCVSGRCRSSKMASVSSDKAFLAHFRLTCDEQCRENTVHDLTLQRYKEKVSNRVEKVLNDLNLLK